MTIGEKIAALRAEHGLSQGDLAEKLNVSRQSVSKWETGQSTPELEKLIQLADLFGVSLDELVRSGAAPRGEIPTTPEPVPAPSGVDTQRIIGFILLALGLVCCIGALLLGRVLLIIGGYLLLCAILCLAVKRHAGLIIGWLSFLLIGIVGPYVVLLPYHNAAAGILMALMVVLTVRACRKK